MRKGLNDNTYALEKIRLSYGFSYKSQENKKLQKCIRIWKFLVMIGSENLIPIQLSENWPNLSLITYITLLLLRSISNF